MIIPGNGSSCRVSLIWCVFFERYIEWAQQSFVQDDVRAVLVPLLEKCTKTLKALDRYNDDIRFVHLWLVYVRCTSHSPPISSLNILPLWAVKFTHSWDPQRRRTAARTLKMCSTSWTRTGSATHMRSSMRDGQMCWKGVAPLHRQTRFTPLPSKGLFETKNKTKQNNLHLHLVCKRIASRADGIPTQGRSASGSLEAQAEAVPAEAHTKDTKGCCGPEAWLERKRCSQQQQQVTSCFTLLPSSSWVQHASWLPLTHITHYQTYMNDQQCVEAKGREDCFDAHFKCTSTTTW